MIGSFRDIDGLRLTVSLSLPDGWPLTVPGAVLETLLQFGAQLVQTPSLRLRTSIVTLKIAWALRLNNSFSYSVSIRGAGEAPSFRLSRSIEGVAEVVSPPLFEGLPTGFSQLLQLIIAWCEFSRMVFASQ